MKTIKFGQFTVSNRNYFRLLQHTAHTGSYHGKMHLHFPRPTNTYEYKHTDSGKNHSGINAYIFKSKIK